MSPTVTEPLPSGQVCWRFPWDCQAAARQRGKKQTSLCKGHHPHTSAAAPTTDVKLTSQPFHLQTQLGSTRSHRFVVWGGSSTFRLLLQAGLLAYGAVYIIQRRYLDAPGCLVSLQALCKRASLENDSPALP